MLIAQFDDIKKAYEYAKNHELQTGIKTKVICLAENAQIFDVVVDCDIEREPLTMERALNVIQEMLQEIDELKTEKDKLQGYIIKEINHAQKYADCYFFEKQKLKKIKEIADKTCASGCKCIDKTDILQIIESEE